MSQQQSGGLVVGGGGGGGVTSTASDMLNCAANAGSSKRGRDVARHPIDLGKPMDLACQEQQGQGQALDSPRKHAKRAASGSKDERIRNMVKTELQYGEPAMAVGQQSHAQHAKHSHAQHAQPQAQLHHHHQQQQQLQQQQTAPSRKQRGRGPKREGRGTDLGDAKRMQGIVDLPTIITSQEASRRNHEDELQVSQ
jgi:hypothetical protein